jgi:glycosyltransferase involved in cell wall biosynthesis
MKQLNLAYVVSTLGRTGPTRQLYNIIKYLDATRARVNLITLSPEPMESLRPDFTGLDISIHTLGFGRIAATFQSRKALSHLLASIKPDILHSQGFRADQLISRLTDHPGRFATQRNIPEHDYPLLYGRLLGSLLAMLHRNALNRIPNLVSCSATIAKNNQNAGITTFIIKNGVDMSTYPKLPTELEKISARSSLNLPLDGRAFVYAGPVISRKNPIFLIKAFLAATQHTQQQLWLLGDGPLLDKCRKLARDCHNVIVRGHVACVDDYLKAADVFVSPSISEGFPNAVLEALASGLPLVLSDIPPHREIIEEDPQVGNLFSLDNPASFASCLRRVNTDNRVRSAAHHLAESRFNGQSMARAYQALYEKIGAGNDDLQIGGHG